MIREQAAVQKGFYRDFWEECVTWIFIMLHLRLPFLNGWKCGNALYLQMELNNGDINQQLCRINVRNLRVVWGDFRAAAFEGGKPHGEEIQEQTSEIKYCFYSSHTGSYIWPPTVSDQIWDVKSFGSIRGSLSWRGCSSVVERTLHMYEAPASPVMFPEEKLIIWRWEKIQAGLEMQHWGNKNLPPKYYASNRTCKSWTCTKVSK